MTNRQVLVLTARRLALGATWLLGATGACAASRAAPHESSRTTVEPGPSASASGASKAKTRPYLDLDPSARPPAAPPDAGATANLPDASPESPPTAYPPAPTCRAVPTTAPLSIDGADTLVDSPSDPRLVSLRKYIKKLSRNVQCAVGHNDGRLFNLDCASYYINADGNPRPGGVEGHLFEWNGRRFEPLPAKKLFPGAKSHGAVLKEICGADDVELFSKVWLDHSGMSFVAGMSPMDQAPCRLEYAQHADWVSCGPLAYLSGYAARAPAPPQALPEPLGWDSGRVMSRLPGQQSIVKLINARIDAFHQALPAHSDGECAPMLTTNQVISVRCTQDFSTERVLNYSVRTGAELDIDVLIAIAGPRLLKAASNACNRSYGKQPKSKYEPFLKAPLDLKRDELTSFEVRTSSVDFHVLMELETRGGSSSTRVETCRLPFSRAGLSLKKLAAVAK